MTDLTTVRRTATLLFLALVPHSAAMAQGVFKCTVDGKTVYQAAPCAGQGKAVEIARGPSEQEVREAKRRADAEKSKTWELQAAHQQRAQEQAARPAVVASGVDCNGLNARRGAAYGKRNGAMRMSRQDNMDRSSDVARAESEIQMIEAQMARSGCRPE